MTSRKITLVAGLVTGALALGACSSTPSSQGSSSSTTVSSPSSVSTTTGSTTTTTTPSTTTTTTATTTSTTSPSTPAGFTMAKQAWENGAMAISADQAMYWNEAAADLASIGAGNAADNEAIAELKQLVSIPETSDTPTQISEAQSDTAALNAFFGTPGLYG